MTFRSLISNSFTSVAGGTSATLSALVAPSVSTAGVTASGDGADNPSKIDWISSVIFPASLRAWATSAKIAVASLPARLAAIKAFLAIPRHILSAMTFKDLISNSPPGGFTAVAGLAAAVPVSSTGAATCTGVASGTMPINSTPSEFFFNFASRCSSHLSPPASRIISSVASANSNIIPSRLY